MENKGSCVVTGGAGFIGSHLCDRLLVHGYRVIALDNFITSRKENLADASKNPNFTFVELDVVEPLKQLNNIFFIFHLASPASPIDYQKYPEETALANSQGTRNLLQLAKKTGARFLFASTSEIYGDPKEHPQKETYWGNVNPNGLRACYDEAKRFGEMLSMVYHRRDGLDVRIARIFNTYGPRMRPNDGRVVSTLINQAIANEPLTVYGDGSQTRSFCYVSDMADGLVKLMFTDGIAGEVVNVGNPEEYRILDLAQKIKVMTGATSTVVFKPLPEDDPKERQPEITKAKKLLGWEPTVSVEDGLQKTIAYYKSLQ
ncbi:SDR family oxidoreductase [Candidatus Gottesmanbacteria bacterium]|nr:SDR family oxidoreductase [Candidatus Gottesmanbacteria bacterium]